MAPASYYLISCLKRSNISAVFLCWIFNGPWWKPRFTKSRLMKRMSETSYYACAKYWIFHDFSSADMVYLKIHFKVIFHNLSVWFFSLLKFENKIAFQAEWKNILTYKTLKVTAKETDFFRQWCYLQCWWWTPKKRAMTVWT